jgi:hypothetical protein
VRQPPAVTEVRLLLDQPAGDDLIVRGGRDEEQKAAQEAMEELKVDFPEFVPGAKDDGKNPGGSEK